MDTLQRAIGLGIKCIGGEASCDRALLQATEDWLYEALLSVNIVVICSHTTDDFARDAVVLMMDSV